MKQEVFQFDTFQSLKEYVEKKTPRLNSHLTYFDPDKWKWILFRDKTKKAR